MLPEERFSWPKFMVQAQEWVSPTLYGLASASGLVVGFVHGYARLVWALAVGAFLISAILVSVARQSGLNRRYEASEAWISAAQDEYRTSMNVLLGDELRNLIHLVGEAIAAGDSDERKSLAASARQTIICATSHMVGRSATTGTRANLFKLSDARDLMALEPNGFFGRGDKSTRVFRPGDRTFDDVIANNVRWVPSVQDESGLDATGLPYQTFLVHPVSIGEDHVHGALTVDCLNPGDLVEDIDTPMMAVLSTLIAITYECEKYPNPRRATSNRVT